MLFTVVIPAFNAAQFIARSVTSVLQQAYTDFELLIINDGSTDATLAECAQFTDNRLKIITQENGGVSRARNRGIAQAAGSYICFLDADDEWLPNHLQLLAGLVENYPERGFLATISYTRQLNGRTIDPFPALEKDQVFVVDNFVRFEAQKGRLFNTNCVCIKRELFEKYGNFVEGQTISEDIDMYNRLMVFEGLVLLSTATSIRHREASVATAVRPTTFVTLFRDRIPGYLQNPRLSVSLKGDLQKYYENSRLSEVRFNILAGRKRVAWQIFKQLDRQLLSGKKYWPTMLALVVPSSWLKALIDYRDKNNYRQSGGKHHE